MSIVNKLVFASAVSEIQQSDIFMTVKARICEAPAANLNGARVTEAFIDEIVSNEERYVGLPLYADVRSLTKGEYRRLGHLYDPKTGEFHSTQIGSFYQFEKETFEGGCYLVGYARIAKRNKKLSKALCELFSDGALKFSFEVSVGEYEELDDETILIDASESNYLEGTAIVTFPACEEAVALELVAQQKADATEGGETEMAGNKEVIEEIAEEKIEEVAEKTEEVSKVKPEATEETAAVVIREVNEQSSSVHAYDTESGAEMHQNIYVTTESVHMEPDAQIVETEDGTRIAEADGDGGEGGDNAGETPAAGTEVADPPANGSGTQENGSGGSGTSESGSDAEEDLPEDPDDQNKKTAEQLIAELAAVVESLKNEVAELKEQKQIAESKTVTAEVNPLLDDISAQGSKYNLLEKETRNTSYSLLNKH